MRLMAVTLKGQRAAVSLHQVNRAEGGMQMLGRANDQGTTYLGGHRESGNNNLETSNEIICKTFIYSRGTGSFEY